MRKRILNLMLVFIILANLIVLLPTTVLGATSGTCGNNLTWVLDDQGTLTISGTGDMEDYSPSSVPWIDMRSDIKNVIIEKGVTSIGRAAFCECEELVDVTIPKGITIIGINAFSYCYELANVDIPEGVTDIGEYAFSYCDKLTSIVIPDSITSIDDGAFFRTSIKNIYITDISKWCMINFAHMESNPIRATTNIYLNNELVTELIIPDGTTSIGDYTFYKCASLTGIEIPSSVTSIGNGAFYNCVNLTSIEIPSSVISIGSNAFCYCSGLSSIIINEGTQEIARSAFDNCSKLKSINLPSTLTSDIVGTGGNMSGINKFLKGCSQLLNITVSDSNPVYSSVGGILYNKDKSILIACPEAKTECTIQTGVTNISQAAFAYCNKLTNIKIPSTVETIGAFAFYECSNILDIYYFASQECWGNISVGINNNILENTTIHYNSCYITYDYATNGGTSASTEYNIATIGENADLTPIATKAGCKFIGWNTNPNAKTALSSYTVTDDVTLYAIYSIPVTGLTLNKSAVILEECGTETLTATVAPSNATDKTVSWTSSNTNVATIADGKVTALKAGTAVITATTTDGGYTANCTVTVTEKVIDENAPKITITDIKTMPGKEIQVTVDLANNTGFASLGIEVGYNSDIMTLTNVTSNTGVGGTFTKAQYLTVNPFNMGWDSASNITYNGNLATLTFTVGEDAPDGIYPITLDYYKGVKGNYVDGDNINYDENFEAVGFVYISGNVIVASYIPGDINGDESVDNKDATYLLRYLAGWSISGLVEDALDVDGSTSVDNKDATILLRYLAGWNVTLH
ncbi:MAG: leucine-rich repeat protein [Clostridiales bacterium]|nr:leucine-rich repeat protein [Clostridiales bacterium]